MITENILALPADIEGHATTIVRRGVFCIAILLGGFTTWACLAPLKGAVISDGIVKIDTNRKTVQHLDGGIVKKILVHEGSIVAENQPLIVLEDTASSSSLNIVIDQLNALRAKEARLTAEASLQNRLNFPNAFEKNRNEKLNEILHNEEALFNAKRKALNDQVELIKKQIVEAGNAIKGYKREISAIADGVKFSQDQVSASEILLGKGFIEKTQLWKLKGELAEKNERLGQVEGQLSLQRENVAELQLRTINLRNEYIKVAEDELKETKKLIFEQEEKYRPAKDAQDRQTINAPIAGQVINLKVSTEQGVIRAGDALLDIVPTSQTLILETRISTKDVDSVRVNQRADIQLSSFNQRITPMVSGEIIYISGDALVDEKTTPPQYFYLAHIKVYPESLKNVSTVNLEPGMPVTAYIQTKERTFVEYILSPIIDRTRRTFKEE